MMTVHDLMQILPTTTNQSLSDKDAETVRDFGRWLFDMEGARAMRTVHSIVEMQSERAAWALDQAWDGIGGWVA